MQKFLSHTAYAFVEWLFRRHSPAHFTMRSGIALIISSLAVGWILSVNVPYKNGVFSLNINNGGGTPALITYGLFVIGVVLTAIGLTWEIIRYKAEQKRLSRKKVVVIESRGLRDTSGSPLCDALPSKLEGHREVILIDIREHIKDGVITSPEAALNKFSPLTHSLRQKENGLDRSDVTIAYGGLTPVPFTFLTGLLIDDEGRVQLFDWDRHKENWRTLDGIDDGKRFTVHGLDALATGTKEIALAVSVSYRVDLQGVQQKKGNIPLIHMELENGSSDCHWSEEKQQALGQEFLNTLISIGNKGVAKIHLFFAAQNSVVFRFGRLYDKRNLPEVVVYQYQKEVTPPYPWGLSMPVHGNENSLVIR